MFLYRVICVQQLVLTSFTLTGCASEQVYRTGPVVPIPVYRGDNLDLQWTTSLPDEQILWCYWKYELGGAWDQFVGFHNTEKKRLNISPWNKGWSFTNIESPCQGGIKRMSVSNEFTGNYVMVIGLQNGTEFESGKFPVSVAGCRRPERVKGANLTTDTDSDNVHVTYTCSHGDNISLECNVTSGQWSDNAPTCQVPMEPEEPKFPGWAVAVLVCVFLLVLGLVLILLLKKTSIWTRRTPYIIPSGELKFSSTYSDTKVKEHCDLHLVVKLSTYRHINVQWFKDDLILVSGKTYTIKHKKNLHSLKIKRSTPEITGVYTCRATDPSDVYITHSARVTVLTGDMFAPVFSESLPSCWKINACSESEMYKAIIKGNPTPEVNIFRNDQKWTGSDHLQLTRTEVTEGIELLLMLSQCTLGDACQLRVEAGNVVGESSKETEIVVQSAPRFLGIPKNVDIYFGEPVEFDIPVEGFPLPKIECYTRNSPVPCTLNDVMKYTCNAHVTLSGKLDESATVVLRAHNSCGEVETSADVRVHPVISPTFTQDLNHVMAKPKEAVVLTAQIEASPAPVVTWFKDKLPLTLSKRFTLDTTINEQKTATTHSMKIYESAAEDIGLYRIKATSDHYQTTWSKEISLTITDKAKKPSFTETPPAKMYVMEGESLQCTAAATGTPTPDIIWELLKKVGDRIAKEDAIGGSNLTVKNMKKEDSDSSYAVIARSKAGETKFTFSVAVLDEPIKPKIMKITGSMTMEGQNAECKAMIEGFPLPDIQWCLNGTEVENGDRFDIKSECSRDMRCRMESVFRISNCRSHDDGFVMLKATNKGGSTSDSSTLTVNVKPEFLKSPPSEITVLKGTDVAIYAKVTGNPPPAITWDRSYSGAIHSDTRRTNLSKFKISNCGNQHTGTYRVSAKNDGGTESKDFNLVVVESEKSLGPNIVSLSDQNAVEGERAIIRAEIRGLPPLSCNWFLNESNVDGISGVHKSVEQPKAPETYSVEGAVEIGTEAFDVEEKKDKDTESEDSAKDNEVPSIGSTESVVDYVEPQTVISATLTIPRCEVGHAGVVNVKATDRNGTASRMCALTVQVKPSFKAVPNDVMTFTKGQSAVLFVDATGEPQPEIKWSLPYRTIGSNIKYATRGSRSTAVIRSFSDQNTGKCKVTATNSVGTEVKDFIITKTDHKT